MPCFDGFEIDAPAGVIFELARPPVFDRTVTHKEGELRVRRGSGMGLFSLHSFESSETPDETFGRAYRAANEALDLLSVQWRDSILIVNPSQHVRWYPIPKGAKVSVRSSMQFGGASQFQGQVTASDGTTVPLIPMLVPAVRKAFRYFRYSQTSASVYDAYSNMFLALEWMLDDVFPSKQAGPSSSPTGLGAQPSNSLGETEWLKEALRRAVQLHQLDINYWKTSSTADAVESFVVQHYNRIRCGVFHAKDSRGNVLLPGDLMGSRTLQLELIQIQEMVEKLLRQRCGVYLASSGIGRSGLLAFLKSYAPHVQLAVFDEDIEALNANSTPRNPILLPVTFFEHSSDPADVGYFLTDIRCRDYSLDRIGCAALFGPKVEGLACGRQIREFVIQNADLAGVEKLEFVVSCKLQNLMTQKVVFSR